MPHPPSGYLLHERVVLDSQGLLTEGELARQVFEVRGHAQRHACGWRRARDGDGRRFFPGRGQGRVGGFLFNAAVVAVAVVCCLLFDAACMLLLLLLVLLWL